MAGSKFSLGMRDAYFEALFPIFRRDPNAVFITADNGAPTLDRFAEELPGQFFTVGIAEQQLIGMACGMALEGKKVYTYAIAPFVTLRCYEQTKLDVCAMNLPIVSIGVGAGYAYDIMGPTHHTVEDITIMRALPNMVVYSPADGVTAAALAHLCHEDRRPQYIRFDRGGVPDLYEDRTPDVRDGICQARAGRDVALIATGIMVHQALKVADALAIRGIAAGVLDLFRIKPIDTACLLAYLADVSRIVTLEEHLLAGGMGSAVLEALVDEGAYLPTLRIGQRDTFMFEMGGREAIWEASGLDVPSMAERIARWVAVGQYPEPSRLAGARKA